MKIKFLLLLGGALTAAWVIGCSSEQREARGFRLPTGNAEQGREAFVALQCHTCHSVTGVELPPAPSPGQHHVTLGGEVLKVKSYGELVTAIIHPAHDISQSFSSTNLEGQLSPMPQFNHVMTVEQLIDLVAFLHEHYKLRPFEYDYHYYGP